MFFHSIVRTYFSSTGSCTLNSRKGLISTEMTMYNIFNIHKIITILSITNDKLQHIQLVRLFFEILINPKPFYMLVLSLALDQLNKLNDAIDSFDNFELNFLIFYYQAVLLLVRFQKYRYSLEIINTIHGNLGIISAREIKDKLNSKVFFVAIWAMFVGKLLLYFVLSRFHKEFIYSNSFANQL